MKFVAEVQSAKKALSGIAICFVSVLGALPVVASQSVGLTWNASTDANVSGYQIYYGPTSGYYTNYVTVGNVTNVNIGGLVDGQTYFFAAKSYSSTGSQSDFSNETIFTGATAQPGTVLHLTSDSLAETGRYRFSLADGAPAGASIDATNGTFSWQPDVSYASTTNHIKVLLEDTQNSNAVTAESLVISVGNYLNVQTGPAVVASGHDGRLPIILTSSGGATNVVFDLTWPANTLLYPTLSSSSSTIACSMQNFGTYLELHFWTLSGQIPAGTNQIGQINFQVASQAASKEFVLPAGGVSGTDAHATSYSTPLSQTGDVVVVGSQPLLKMALTSNSGKKLVVYSNPQPSCQLQMTTNLVTWQTMLTYSQTNLTQEIALPNAGPAVFYRIIHQ